MVIIRRLFALDGYCACLHGAHSLNADLYPIVLEMGWPRDIGKTFQPRPHVPISPLEQKDCGEAGVEVVPWGPRVDTRIL